MIEHLAAHADRPGRPDLPVGQSYVVTAVHEDGTWDVEVLAPDLRVSQVSGIDLTALTVARAAASEMSPIGASHRAITALCDALSPHPKETP